MVFVLVLATIVVFLAVDYILKREERQLKVAEKNGRSPIFLSPEKALTAFKATDARMFHHSHTWTEPFQEDVYAVGFDSFVSENFDGEIKLSGLKAPGDVVQQGDHLWDIEFGPNHLPQLAPLSGKIVDINPACKMNTPLPIDGAGKSWLLKIRPENLERERMNLIDAAQAEVLNTTLRDDLVLTAQTGHYLNDGGKISSDFIGSMDAAEWKRLLDKFFAYHKFSDK